MDFQRLKLLLVRYRMKKVSQTIISILRIIIVILIITSICKTTIIIIIITSIITQII